MLLSERKLKKIIREYFEIEFSENISDDKKKTLLKNLFKMLSLNDDTLN
tara:strand:+ start:863 stop:1009 length:147 start_codon:yes stop_codon:yes gene_type:complete